MKIDKKKIVFASILLIVLIFIVSYSILVSFGEEELQTLEQPVVPELMEEETTYTSKMKALDALKEERERQIPSVYSEALLDSMGVYDPALEEKEREWVIDSIYQSSLIGNESPYTQENFMDEDSSVKDTAELQQPGIEDMAVDHNSFFHAGNNSADLPGQTIAHDESFTAVVNGDQTVRTNDRLELRLKEKMEIGGNIFPKNTPVFGFVTLQPNRVQIKITHIENIPVQLKAFDLQDSNEGIYLRNSFRDEAGRKILDDVVQDIKIAGLPQVSGIKSIFRKNNRNLKVKVIDQYQLLLKP